MVTVRKETLMAGVQALDLSIVFFVYFFLVIGTGSFWQR